MPNSVIKPRQRSPEHSEDEAKPHNILQIYRPVFDLLGPSCVACMHHCAHTYTHTQKYRGREQILLLQKRRPVGRYPLQDETREKMIDMGRLQRGRERQTYLSNEGR